MPEQYAILSRLFGKENGYLDPNYNFRFLDINVDPRVFFGQAMMTEPMPEAYRHALVGRILELKRQQVLNVVQVTLTGRVECEYPQGWLTELIQDLIEHRIFIQAADEYESMSQFCLLAKHNGLTMDEVFAMIE